MERYFYLTKGSEYFFHHWLHTANCLESQWPVQADPFLTNPPKGLTTTTWPEPHTVCWVRTARLQPQFTSRHNLCWRPISGDLSPLSSFLPLLHARCQVGQILNQTHEEFTSGPLCRQGLVQTCFPSMGAWHQLGNPGLVLVSGTPPMPHWGWRHSRKNYTLCECLSPSVYYKNHCAPTSPWLSENSHEQSVKHYPGKPVITTSGSIWLSVGRALAQRETVTVCKKRSPWLL